MSFEDKVKLFGLSTPSLERELDKVESRFSIELHRAREADQDEEYYPQFSNALRSEARAMGDHYELFYCLERSIRRLVSETMDSQYGAAWWTEKVPQDVQKNASDNIARERDAGITVRSEENIDFTTFGELGEIVRKNWDAFDPLFSSVKAFNKIMTSLNNLRASIAHCCPLAEDEVLRLRLTVKDWFRLME